MITVRDIYDFIDSPDFAPFSQQQSYDNSGICVGEGSEPVSSVLTSLDITCDVVREAYDKKIGLIISHHPVIFRGLRRLVPYDPAVMLAKSGIAAICVHTNFDSAKNGMNDLLAARLGLEVAEPLTFEEGKPIGYVCKTNFAASAQHMAALCKKRLGCRTVRFTDSVKPIDRVAVCSGSGGGFMDAALRNDCAALITGDVRHNQFIDAVNCGFCLIDAGHYYTENIFHEYFAQRLAAQFPELVIEKADSAPDPVRYL